MKLERRQPSPANKQTTVCFTHEFNSKTLRLLAAARQERQGPRRGARARRRALRRARRRARAARALSWHRDSGRSSPARARAPGDRHAAAAAKAPRASRARRWRSLYARMYHEAESARQKPNSTTPTSAVARTSPSSAGRRKRLGASLATGRQNCGSGGGGTTSLSGGKARAIALPRGPSCRLLRRRKHTCERLGGVSVRRSPRSRALAANGAW